MEHSELKYCSLLAVYTRSTWWLQSRCYSVVVLKEEYQVARPRENRELNLDLKGQCFGFHLA
jgi:hypothetical protein